MMSFMMLFSSTHIHQDELYLFNTNNNLLTLTFRKVVNEEKLLLQLEANKRKPKKKSGFMQRLEEAQKMQEQQARQRAKNNSKRKR